MGGIKLVKEDPEELETLEIRDIDPDEALWIFHSSDWVNVYTGEMLSNYNPTRLDESKRKKIRYLQET
jgi:hypothetical protein